MRVLHVDTAMELRGGQRQLAYLLGARPGDAWAGPPGAPLAREIGPPAVPLRPGNDPRNLLALRAACRAGDWDLVAAQTPHALGASLLVDLPVVAHRRVDFPVRDPWKWRRADRIVAVSHAVAKVLARQGLASEVVHDGIVAPVEGEPPQSLWARARVGEAPAGGGTDGPLVVAVGALVPHKGHALLLEAMAGLPGRVVVAGEGPLRATLLARARAPDLAGRVALPGHVEGVGSLLRAAHVVVHPSREEGFGQAVLEAMACGCRVVVTDAGGLPELVGDCAEVVAPRPDALRAGILRALARPRGEGVARAAAFSVARMVAGTEIVYASVLAGR
jgi:glycosyltransferase involved in cell wall biosynthesis